MAATVSEGRGTFLSPKNFDKDIMRRVFVAHAAVLLANQTPSLIIFSKVLVDAV